MQTKLTSSLPFEYFILLLMTDKYYFNFIWFYVKVPVLSKQTVSISPPSIILPGEIQKILAFFKFYIAAII
jgi:hypothetical protein